MARHGVQFGRGADDRFERFGTAHITALEAHPRFSYLAKPTQEALDVNYGARSGIDQKGRKRSAWTQAVQDRLEEFQVLASRHAGAISSLWGKDSLEYRRFYPLGVSEYRQANLQTISALMDRYAEVLEEFKPGLPPHVLADFLAPLPDDADPLGTEGGVIPRFRAVRAVHLALKGGLEETRRQRSGSRQALEDQIMENVLKISLAVLREDRKSKLEALALFPQALLRRPKRKTAVEDGLDKPSIAAAPAVGVVALTAPGTAQETLTPSGTDVAGDRATANGSGAARDQEGALAG